MGVHVYCIVPPDHAPPPGCTGIDGADVTAIGAHGVALWTSRHDRPPPTATAAIRTHDAVVRAAMDRSITPVPVRFGQWFEDADAAAGLVAADAGRWRTLLERFAGHAEYGVRMSPARDAVAARDVRAAAHGSGTAYMAALAQRDALATERRRAGERVAAVITQRGAGLVTDTRIDTSGGTVTLSCLVAWEHAEAYTSMIRDVSAASGDVRLLSTGPWPPYSFVA